MSTDVQKIIDKNPQKRGLAVIVTNDYTDLPSGHLPGCHKDGDEMDKTLVDVHNFARYRVKNFSAKQMSDLFAYTAQCRYPKSYKYIAVVFSGHGQKGALIGNDGYPVDVNKQVVDPFEPSQNPKNMHIVKLFFFDACRGEFDMQRAQPKGKLGPELGNYLIAYATTEGYVSWATTSGSYWMVPLAKKLRTEKASIQDLVSSMRTYLRENDMQHLQAPVTIVACGVVKLFEDDDGDGVVAVRGSPRGRGRGKELPEEEVSENKQKTAKEKFNTDNVSYFLGKVRFPPEKWNRLATNLRLAGIVNTIAAEFGDDTKRLGKLVTHWCANDSSASWQKLVEAVSDCDELLKAKKLAEKVGADPPEED